jgi:acyl-CoA synthetase (AMP-forming)/AMP-acid ligase II
VAVIGSDAILSETRTRTEGGAGVCVGRPVDGMEVAIIPISDGPIEHWSDDLRLPPGETGEIVVKGPVVTPGYYRRPESTALAKIRDGDAIRHRMGDVGYLDADGRLWMCGRKAHRVDLPDGPMFTVPCEAPFNAHPAVYRSALVGVSRAGVTLPVLCVEPEPGKTAPHDELRAIAQAHPHTRAIETFLSHDGFPVDVRHNSKIFREKLADWAQEQLR